MDKRVPKPPKGRTGIRGCCAWIKGRYDWRFCAQPYFVIRNGAGYCWYHNPDAPHKFGDGFRNGRAIGKKGGE